MSEAPIEQPVTTDLTKASDEELTKAVDCYSLMFSMHEDICTECLVRDRCITIMAKNTLPRTAHQWREENKRDPSHDDLAETLGTDAASVGILYQIRAGKKIGELLPPQATDRPPEPITDEADEEADTVVDAPKESAEEEDEAPPAKVAAKKKQAAAPAPLKAKKKKAPPVVKEKPAKKVAAPTKKERQPKPAKEPATDVVPFAGSPPPYDEVEFHKQWNRERHRSPAVEQLPVGTKIERAYKGVMFVVHYRKGYVEWNGQKWPTLSAVRSAMSPSRSYPRTDGSKSKRVMPNWSIPRFFGLEKKKPAAKKKKKS